MKILKFGGTSLGTIENLYKVKNILDNDTDQKIVVCSAMSGVTNQLISISESVRLKNKEDIELKLGELRNKHIDIIRGLIDDHTVRNKVENFVDEVSNKILELSYLEYTEDLHSRIITYGETLLTQMFSSFLDHIGISNVLLIAEEFMWVDTIENPNIKKISKRLESILASIPKSQLYITQGFICKNANGDIDNLRRGGSDYSATIIGAALAAREIEIWTDIDGVHNNDPRYVDATYSIPYLSYSEASKLAYFGAKVLHPQTIVPVIDIDIPVVLKDTTNPDAAGTIISNKTYRQGVKGVSAKDDITGISIKSKKILKGYDFLTSIFEIFNKYQTTIDMVTTTEKSIFLTIDNPNKLIDIVNDINRLGEVTVMPHQSIICIVGESIIQDKNSHRIFEILNHISVKMISYGSSTNNISILVDSRDKIDTLRLLHKKLFLEQSEMVVL